MSLYVRLQISFFTNRKTVRLFQALGKDAYWIPPRLWAYAAQNQPDGDFSDYSPDELKMLLGFDGDATSMLEALKHAGFLDDMKIHGWDEHNGYHSIFSDRAKKAAAARWKGKDKKGNDRKGKEQASDKHATSILAFPKTLDTDAFKTRFADWQKTRRGMGKKPVDWNVMFQEQLGWLDGFGEKSAIEILSASIRNNWQGLFPPKNGSNSPAPKKLRSALDSQ